eukprot:g5114.t1
MNAHAGAREARLHADAGAMEDALANQEAFKMFDADGDGVVTASERADVMRKLGMQQARGHQNEALSLHRRRAQANTRTQFPAVLSSSQRALGMPAVDAAQRRRERFRRKWGQTLLETGTGGGGGSATQQHGAGGHLSQPQYGRCPGETAVPNFSWERPRSLRAGAPTLHEVSSQRTQQRQQQQQEESATTAAAAASELDAADRLLFDYKRSGSRSRMGATLFGGPALGAGRFARSSQLDGAAKATATADEMAQMRKEAAGVAVWGGGQRGQVCLRRKAPTGKYASFLRDASSETLQL